MLPIKPSMLFNQTCPNTSTSYNIRIQAPTQNPLSVVTNFPVLLTGLINFHISADNWNQCSDWESNQGLLMLSFDWSLPSCNLIHWMILISTWMRFATCTWILGSADSATCSWTCPKKSFKNGISCLQNACWWLIAFGKHHQIHLQQVEAVCLYI